MVAFAPAFAVGAADASRHPRRAQLPLAIVMVLLTTVTLWSLGQTVFRPEATATTPVPVLAGIDGGLQP